MRTASDRELLEDARDVMLAAIKAGDWKVDGACDPEMVLLRIAERLNRCGDCGKPNAPEHTCIPEKITHDIKSKMGDW